MLRLLTAGESHGPGLSVIIDGLPAGLPIRSDQIDADLARRQKGYGRGGRMKIEQDRVIIRSGIRLGKTTGSPVCLLIDNRDYANWRESMQPEPAEDSVEPPDIQLTRPRPGHADLAGALKFLNPDVRNILERASARSTAARVAAGAVARALLSEHGIFLTSHVLAIGGVRVGRVPTNLEQLTQHAEASAVRCADEKAAAQMIAAIDTARKAGDSLGGVVEVLVDRVPPGLGHFSDWDRRLDGRLAQALMSVPAIKAVEIGDGFAASAAHGSQVHDPIHFDQTSTRYVRPTNHAGGIEGGMSNGERIVVRAYMKPIPTLARPLRSVDLRNHEIADAGKERTDSCAVPAAAVVCEAVVGWELASAFVERFGGETLSELHFSYERYLQQLNDFCVGAG